MRVCGGGGGGGGDSGAAVVPHTYLRPLRRITWTTVADGINIILCSP